MSFIKIIFLTLKLFQKLDNIRFEILNNQIQVNNYKKRILHIANFNENADGRLYYSLQTNLIMDLLKTVIL